MAMLVVMFLASCTGSDDSDDGSTLHVGDLLPLFYVEMSDGSVVNSIDLKETVSVILFFHTDCGDCQRQLPEVEKLYQHFIDNRDVMIFGISRAQGQGVIQEYWEENGISFPYSPQENRSVYELFASRTVPRIYISDRDRIIRFISTDSPTRSFEELLYEVNNLL